MERLYKLKICQNVGFEELVLLKVLNSHTFWFSSYTCPYLAKLTILWLYVLAMSCTCFRVNTLYSCLNVKELLAQSRHEIWSLSDCNWTRIQNHLVRKETLNHLASWPDGWVFVYKLSGSGFESSCSNHFMFCILIYG